MTINEAINELTQCYSLNSKIAEKKNEAISMAIEALERQRWIPVTKEEVFKAGYEGREIRFQVDGRLFAIRELAQ